MFNQELRENPYCYSYDYTVFSVQHLISQWYLVEIQLIPKHNYLSGRGFSFYACL